MEPRIIQAQINGTNLRFLRPTQVDLIAFYLVLLLANSLVDSDQRSIKTVKTLWKSLQANNAPKTVGRCYKCTQPQAPTTTLALVLLLKLQLLLLLLLLLLLIYWFSSSLLLFSNGSSIMNTALPTLPAAFLVFLLSEAGTDPIIHHQFESFPKKNKEIVSFF